MKKIIMLTLCVFFSHAYASSSDDPDFFKNRYQTGNWKHNKVTPYNTAGSTQSDYYNSSKYNVNSSRDVTSNGSKYKQTVNVAVEASKAEKAATIASRAKNMAEYAKKLGKASLPAFLGSAALTGLIEGIGWVMDDGGKVTRKRELNDERSSIPNTPTYFQEQTLNTFNSQPVNRFFTPSEVGPMCSAVKAYYPSEPNLYCKLEGSSFKFYYPDGRLMGTAWTLKTNPSYKPNEPPPSDVEVTPKEIEDAIKKALEANNAAQAAAIAEAIKDAFSESDLDINPNTGKKENPIADRTKKALDEKGTAELKEKDDPTVCVPRQGDLNGQCHSMPKSEADAQPTLKCEKQAWQIDTDDSCVYVVDPDAPPKPGTVDKPKVDPESGELPDACVWFDVHCKWLEWTKDDDLSEDTELDLDNKNEPEANTEIKYSGICPADKVYQAPPPLNFPVSLTYEPLCKIAETAKPAIVAIGLLISSLIIGGIKGAD